MVRVVQLDTIRRKTIYEIIMSWKQLLAARWVIVAAVLAWAAAPALAHHSFAAEYDKEKPLKFTGTVTKFDLTNPHSWIYIDVMQPDGTVENWAFETASPSNLYRRGFRKDTIKPGMVITIEGFGAKDATHTGNGQRLTMPDGKQYVLGTEENPG
jgi:hypothetical protein